MSLGQHDHDAMRATNGKLCAPRVRTKPVSRGVHVWNSSHLVARYVLIHVGARMTPITALFTEGALPTSEVQSV